MYEQKYFSSLGKLHFIQIIFVVTFGKKKKTQHILNILQMNESENMRIWLYQTFSGKRVILKSPPLLGNV